jgi:hypothetical protein
VRQASSPGVGHPGFRTRWTVEAASLGPINLDHRAIVDHDQKLSKPQSRERFDDRLERLAQRSGAGDGINL